MSWQNGDGGWTWEEGKEGCGETPPEEVGWSKHNEVA